MSSGNGNFHDKTIPCPDFLILNCGLGGIGFLETVTVAVGGGGNGAGWRMIFLFLITLEGVGDCNLTWPALNAVCGREQIVDDPFCKAGMIPFVGPANTV